MPPPNPPVHHHGQTQPKRSPRLLSILFKAVVMTVLTAFFFILLGFAAFVLLHLCFICGIYQCVRSRHTANQLGASSKETAPIKVHKLPEFRVTRATEPEPEIECVVCLDGFRSGHWCRKLAGCGHMFHRKCVDAWLVKVAACPICRTPVQLNASAALHVNREEAMRHETSTRDNAFWIF